MVPYKKRPGEKKPGIIPYPKEKVAPLCRSIAPEAGQPSFYALALALPQFKYFLHRCVPLQIGRPWLPSQHLEEREKKQDGPFCKKNLLQGGGNRGDSQRRNEKHKLLYPVKPPIFVKTKRKAQRLRWQRQHNSPGQPFENHPKTSREVPAGGVRPVFPNPAPYQMLK